MSTIPFIAFGTGEIAVGVLDELVRAGLPPALVVTTPDAPAGRGRELSPSAVARWAAARDIETCKPARLDETFAAELQKRRAELDAEVFVVTDYGKILPRRILDLPPRGTVNMHPSLLPLLRGPSPIRTAILEDRRETGVSIILIDELVDHGPLLAQRAVDMPQWPMPGRELDTLLAREGGKLLAETLPHYLSGALAPREQDHAHATFTHMFAKTDGELDLRDGNPRQNLLKIRAFDGWPGTFAYFRRGNARIRAKITAAHEAGGTLVIDRIIPEGKNEMSYEDFLRSGAHLA